MCDPYKCVSNGLTLFYFLGGFIKEDRLISLLNIVNGESTMTTFKLISPSRLFNLHATLYAFLSFSFSKVFHAFISQTEKLFHKSPEDTYEPWRYNTFRIWNWTWSFWASDERTGELSVSVLMKRKKLYLCWVRCTFTWETNKARFKCMKQN